MPLAVLNLNRQERLRPFLVTDLQERHSRNQIVLPTSPRREFQTTGRSREDENRAAKLPAQHLKADALKRPRFLFCWRLTDRPAH
jgi:hypothetical protein